MTKRQCRICLKDGQMSSIFLKQGTLMISTQIMCLAKVHIYPDDGLPSTICSKCIYKVKYCIEFINLCEVSDLKLRASIKSDVDEPVNEATTESDNYDQINLEVNNYKLKTENTESCPENNIEVSDSQLIKKENFKNITPTKNDEKKIEKQQCFTCGKVMSSRFRLKTHLRTHTGERPFTCPHCNKNFSLAQNLKVHLRTHTGEKPLHCSVCGETFAQSAGLAAHKRKHTGQTPYHCVLCPRSFRTIGHLQYHTRRHTGEKNFECDTCGRAFITRSDLKQHLLTHTGNRPHVCCVCGLRLTRASHLKRHIQHMHNGLKPFSCSECSMNFTMKSDFEKHKKTHSVTRETLEES